MRILSMIAIVGLFCQFPLMAQRQTEPLNRGLVAVRASSSSVFLSWRLLKSDGYDTYFNVYRDGTKLNTTPIKTATCYTDATATSNLPYTVKTVINGVEVTESESATPTSTLLYHSIPLNVPASGVTEPNKYGSVGKAATGSYPKGQPYSYSPNDCSVGDLDGDGQYEIVVKWDPSNSQDNSYYGITGEVFIDAYKLDGTQLWRICLGKNIRAGAHYTQFLVYDFDGDGMAELICKTAPGTKDGLGNHVIMNSDDSTADYRYLDTTQISGSKMLGTIQTCPEYLTLFDGKTGAELNTVAYNPQRGSSSSWGDSYYNRSERYLACVAFLDGIHPSAVMCRGYYAKTTLASYRVVDKKLVQQWFYDSGTTAGVGAYGQGNHNLSVADVDGDSKDEIIYGSCAFNEDGTLLYRTGLGHGDAMHVSDLIPTHPGLEVFAVKEESIDLTKATEIHDAATGENLVAIGVPKKTDVGRGVAADIDPRYPGYEFWSSADSVFSSYTGGVVAKSKPTTNFCIYWDGDLSRELLDGYTTTIQKWNYLTSKRTSLLTASDLSNNTTKQTPCLQADLYGDWREEAIYRSADNSALHIYSTTTSTNYRFFSLMQDPVYREAIAWQNVAYNQPPHPGFYLGTDLETKMKSTDTLLCYTSPSMEASSVPYHTILWSNGSSGATLSVDTSVYKVNTSQKFVARYRIHGFETKDSINVKVYKPMASISLNSDGLCANGSSLSAYHWYVNDTLIPGASARTFIPSHPGTYKVVVEGLLAGCKNASSEFILKGEDENISICDGSSYMGQTKAGLYTSFSNDTLLYTHLSVLPSYHLTDMVAICEGATYKGYADAGVYMENRVTSLGCDSIITSVLSVNPKFEVSRQVTLCYGESYEGHSASYVQTYKTTCNCDSIVNTELVIADPIDTTVTVHGQMLTANAMDVEYQWIQQGNGLILDSMQSYTASQTGTFAVIVSKESCSDTSGWHSVVVAPNANESIAERIAIYPNPTKGMLYVAWVGQPDVVDITVTDLAGRVVYQQHEMGQAQIRIHLSDVPDGLYLLQLSSAGRSVTYKVKKISK